MECGGRPWIRMGSLCSCGAMALPAPFVPRFNPSSASNADGAIVQELPYCHPFITASLPSRGTVVGIVMGWSPARRIDAPFHFSFMKHTLRIRWLGAERASSFLAILGAALSHAEAAVVVTLNPLQDSTLYESTSGSVANGAGKNFFAGVTGSGVKLRSLMQFDISGAVPSGALIEKVELRLHLDRTATIGELITMHRVLASWTEGASDATFIGGGGGGTVAGAADSTWLHRSYSGLLWSSPGGDFTASPSSSLEVEGTGFYTWSGAGLVSDVQSWLLTPSLNHGWLLKTPELGPASAKRFGSSESDFLGSRPALSITYSSIPEVQPTSGTGVGLLGLVALRWFARRQTNAR